MSFSIGSFALFNHPIFPKFSSLFSSLISASAIFSHLAVIPGQNRTKPDPIEKTKLFKKRV